LFFFSCARASKTFNRIIWGSITSLDVIISPKNIWGIFHQQYKSLQSLTAHLTVPDDDCDNGQIPSPISTFNCFDACRNLTKLDFDSAISNQQHPLDLLTKLSSLQSLAIQSKSIIYFESIVSITNLTSLRIKNSLESAQIQHTYIFLYILLIVFLFSDWYRTPH